MVTPGDCSVCRQALPHGEAVAFAEKQQLIHIACYKPSTNADAGRAITVRRGGRVTAPAPNLTPGQRFDDRPARSV
jgi:hypothetical protein